MTLDLLDWRRSVHALYAAVRAEPDPLAAHALWVEERQRLVTGHPQSPNPRAKLHVAAYDPRWRIEAALEHTDPLRIEIATATDGVVPFVRIGRVDAGAIGRLDVWWLDSYGGGVWLPLRDTSPQTYGGGRYVLDTVKGADLGGTFDATTGEGSLIVDLNFAYNPSCAYDPAWTCPLAPEGNRTLEQVAVGELLPS